MNKRKLFVSDKTTKQDKSVEKSVGKITQKTEKLVISSVNEKTDSSEHDQSSKHVYKKRTEFPADQQAMDDDDSPRQKAIQGTSEKNCDRFTQDLLSQDIDNSSNSSESENEFVIRKGEKRNKLSFKSKFLQLFTKKKSISQMDKSNKTANAPTSNVDSIKPIASLSTHETLCPSTNSTDSIEMTDVSSNSAHSPSTFMTSCKSENMSESSKFKTSEEVMQHFRFYLQSNKEHFDGINVGNDIKKGGMKAFSESRNQDTKDLNKPKILSTNRGSENPTRGAMVSSTTQGSRRMVSEVSKTEGANSTATIKNTRNNPRQRIMHNVAGQGTRWWLLQQIKDREMLIKFRIIEGMYSNDMETKIRCIEQAKYMQSQIEEYFDELSDHDKLENETEEFKPADKDILRSLKKSKEFKKLKEASEEKINTIFSLFRHLYKSKGSETKIENILARVNRRQLVSVYTRYLAVKKKFDHDAETSKLSCKSAVDDFYLSLVECRLIVKFKIAHPRNRSVEEYQIYVNNLRTAVDENLECLYTLIPLATSVIFPLISYLSQFFKKQRQVLTFLEEVRTDVFPENLDRNKIWFEDFCRRHFKDGC